MATRIILNRDDSLASIIAGVLDALERHVEVLVPLGQEVLFREDNLLELFQESQAGGKSVTLLSDDQHLRGIARRIGFMVGGAFDADRRHRPVSDIVVKPAEPAMKSEEPLVFHNEESVRPVEVSEDSAISESVEGEAILDVGTRLPHVKAPSFLKSKIAMTVGLIVVGLVVAGGTLGVVLPTVEVTIVPRSEELHLELPLKASTNPKEGELAAQQVSEEVSLTQEYPASGKADVTTAASGTVRIFNASGAESQTLVEKTRLVSQDGKLFRTVATVVVPGANVSGGNIEPSSIEVGVVAAEPGPEYNISPSTFSIPGFQGTPKYTKFYGKSEEPMHGGARGVTAIVTEEDITKANEGLEAKAIEEIEAKFKAKNPSSLVLLDDAKLRTINIVTNVKAGESADKVVATAEAKVQALLFSQSDVMAQADAAIYKQLGADIVILPGSLSVSYVVSERSFEKGILKVSARVSAKAARAIAIDTLKLDIAGRKEPEIRAVLANNENIDFSRVTFSPFFVSRAPKNSDRIKVTIEYENNKP